MNTQKDRIKGSASRGIQNIKGKISQTRQVKMDFHINDVDSHVCKRFTPYIAYLDNIKKIRI